ncbi:MAG: hypothetical protein LBG15_01370 [Dysgonamonadaceae bacterium]|nr:hypothetical protein [Dysgonamonadaceae bacterium]
MKIEFEGQAYQIDANTLINTLVHYNALINQINEIIGEGEKKIELKVNAPERGSFVIDMTINAKLMETIFSSTTLNYTASIITILGGVFAAYKYFKGKPSKEGDNEDVIKKIVEENNIIITNSSFVTVYNNPTVRSAISKSIETASNDSAVEGIKLSSNNNKLVEIKKEDFADLVYDEFDKEVEVEEIKHIVDKEIYLGIITLSFEKRKNWEFMYKGFKISMPMKDSRLSALIDEGMRFAKGDSIVVDLEITQEFNREYNVYQNKKFRIVRFVRHIPRAKEQSFLEE